jgi:hypothetical protein
MELLFSPCTRYRDIVESHGGLEEFGGPNPELLRELNLDVSTEELLSAERAFTYADLYAVLGNEDTDTLAWLTPHAAVVRNGEVARTWNELDELYSFRCNAEGMDIIAVALSSEHLLEICDFLFRLLAVSVVHSVIIEEWNCPDDALMNAPTLAYLMEQCQSLKVLTLEALSMDENHCRVLGDYSRPDLEIVLVDCAISDAGANALAEVLGRNQGPTKLRSCFSDFNVLANGLRGNNRLKSLTLQLYRDVGSQALLAIAGALRENRGLVELGLSHHGVHVSDATWDAVCDSLETHPTLEVLDLRSTLFQAKLKSRIQAILDMVKINRSIHTIRLNGCYYEHELFRGSVVPYLETNRFRPRLLAIQRTRPITYRDKVLGRALLAVRTDPNRFWMLLSGNAEVAFPSTNATTTTAASLPTPANVTATENVAPVVANASAAGASSAVASAAGQKRKACP